MHYIYRKGGPMKYILLAAFLLFQTVTFADDIPSQSACYLKLKVIGENPNLDAEVGSAIVEVSMVDGNKKPIEGIEISFEANAGTFQCYPAGKTMETDEDDSVLRACFRTDAKGIARVHFVNIPFNLLVNIKATAECSDMTVYGTGNISLKKQTRR
jgi:hypothetical protein